MAWFRKKRGSKRPVGDRKRDMPEGLWTKCNHCNEFIYRKEVARNSNVCPKCNYHFRISAQERLELLCDDEAWEEFGSEIAPIDPLGFHDTKKYPDRLVDYQKRTGRKDAVVAVSVGINEDFSIGDREAVLAALHDDWTGFNSYPPDEWYSYARQDIGPDWYTTPFKMWWDDYEVLISPDLAILSGIITGEDGVSSFTTAVFKKEEGQWKLIHAHMSYAEL